MKKVLSMILAIALMFSLMPTGLFTITASAAQSGYYTYTVYNGKATITACDPKASGAITISSIGGYPVTSIGPGAFYYCYRITSVTIGDTVTSIGAGAFDKCAALTSVTIGDGVTSIGEEAFYMCSSLSDVTLGSSVTSIGASAFKSCGLTEITIPDSVTSIDQEAFYGCGGLTSITIPDSVTKIGNGAFYGCGRLPSVVLGNSVASIGDDAFCGCTNLTSITIPNSVTSIGDYAFCGCTNLTNVTIGDNVASIGYYAFDRCSKVTDVYVTDPNAWCKISFGNYTSNPAYASGNVHIVDENGEELSTIVLDKTVTSIPAYGFLNCKSLTSITIPDSTTIIDDSAFAGCTNLTSVTIGKRVTSIGSSVFRNCSNLTDIIIPDSITSINSNAFTGCTGLNYNIYDNGNYLGNNNNPYFVFIAPMSTSITSFQLHSKTEIIAGYAFSNCTSLNSIILPRSVTISDRYAFHNCKNLKDVWYQGSVYNKENMQIVADDQSGYQSNLRAATWHYNTCSEKHSYSSECDASCNYCEWVRTSEVGHAFDNDCDNSCNLCEYIRAVPEHIFDNICDGECNICGFLRDAHDYEWVVDQLETCGENGTMHEECTVCRYKRSENTVITATGNHIYDNDCDAVCGVCQFERTVGDHQYALNGELTCSSCKYSKAPETPAVLVVTTDSLTLISKDGLEYSIDGVTWQDSPTFNNLTQNTQYTFYQRVKASDNAMVSESSPGLVIDFRTKTIRYDANGGQNAPNSQVALVSATIVLSSSTPTREGYRFAGWATKESCGRQYAPGEQYLDERDVTFYALWQEACTTCQGMGNVAVSQACVCDNGKVKSENSECRSCGWTDCISVVTTGSGSYNYCRKCGGMNTGYFYTTTEKHGRCNGTGTISSSERCSDCAGSGIEDSQIPTPVISSFTDTTVVLQPLNGYEYSMDGATWQESNVFANLSPATLYYFYCRVGATADAPFGLPSNSITVRTDKSIQTQISPSPIAESVTSSSITLVAVDGCEYSKDGTTWQASPSFTGLSVATKYTFYQRYKETTTTYAGKTSDALVIKTDKGTQSQPTQPTLSSKNHRKVVLRSVYGCEYSKDGINWQSSPEFTELTPSTNYYFYIRKAEKDSYYASNMSTALVVRTDDLPLFTPGDVDGDGEVSDWDGVMLARYLAGWTVEVEPTALDIDGDGEVTDWDGVILDRYLAGWDITIG